jgi:predicted amidohydrolase
MNAKLIQQALNAAINLDIRNAREHLDMTLAEHAEAFGKIAPNISKALVIIGKLNIDKMQAEAN